MSDMNLEEQQNQTKVDKILDNAVTVSNIVELATSAVINMAGKDDFIYCDPPYEPLSKTSNFNAYQANGFSQDQQRRLKEACLRAQKRGAFVIISNSSAEFIKELYKDCELKFLAAKRVINSKGDKRGEINEVAVILPALSGSNLPISSYEPFVTCEFR